ncbi:MAG TPA: DUF134 domain-containing protein [Methanothermococcus okinawensis]|uniref:UPF0251 protein EYH15_04660 n=1 Tax=Methanothermococcus okinawensis TaxID=155863 RepID=A0A832ZBL8_9EURY|nr:DUF134 domain-containing protein [Methanococcaceae archaeon]HIP84760.1 DUF134 domain-containing protein [Methanothermococcus okinawensis]HIP90943.1 DUF134 domain-containing protein [Methanothermococcus okinawensis]
MRCRRRKGRPRIPRFISEVPEIKEFVPRGVPLEGRETVTLSYEELEAVRLVDYLGFSQEEGAELMGVSRRVFWSILRSARRKISDFLINGKVLRIEGENYKLRECGIGKLCGKMRHCAFKPEDHCRRFNP